MKIFVKESLNTSKSKLKAYLYSNMDKYVEKERAYVDIIFLPYKPSITDLADFNKDANAVLKQSIKAKTLPRNVQKETLTRKEFANKYGKKYFRKNEVVPHLIADGDSKIIAKEIDGSIEFIKLDPIISEKTKKDVEDLSNRIMKEIEDGSEFSKLRDLYSDVNFKKQQTVYRDGKFEKNLEKAVLKYDNLRNVYTEKGIYVYKRSSYFPLQETCSK